MADSAVMAAPAGTARMFQSGHRLSLADHLGAYGPLPASVDIAEIERCALRGRGGAGFPTAVKMRAVASAKRRSILVANGAEGEPASLKDVGLLSRSPHLVLDGIALAGTAVGATEAFVCVARGASDAAASVATAIRERRDRIPVRLVRPPDRYVAGEESALIHWLNGGDAKPTLVPPRPFERGVSGKPTLVQNVETFASIALIARYGAGWFRAVGAAEEPGTRLVTLSGAVARPGVYEIANGTTIGRIVEAAGGDRASIGALLTGGYFGTWLATSTAWDLALTHAALARGGASIGCGVLVAFPASACGVREAARVARYLADENARQCGPCRFGLDAIAGEASALADGRMKQGAGERIARWSSQIQGRGACHHPDGAVRFVQTALHVFAGDVARHRSGRPCAPGTAVLPIPAPVEDSWR